MQGNHISKRMSAGAASLDGKLYIFGGADGADRLNDLQVWDPSSSRWTELNANSSNTPLPREGHGLAAVKSRQKLYMLGGVVNIAGQDSLSTNFHEFDLETAEWKNLSHFNAVPGRAYFGFTSAGDTLYLFGGISDNDTSCTIYSFNTTSYVWTCAADIGSYPRVFHIMPGMTFSGSKLYIFGGLAASGLDFSLWDLIDTWMRN